MTEQDANGGYDGFDAGTFARAFQQFLEDFRRMVPPAGVSLRSRVATFLGADPGGLPSVSESFDAAELPNVQLALDALVEQSQQHETIGIPGEMRSHHGFSLAALLGGRIWGVSDVGPVEYVNAAIDVDRAHPCALVALYLVASDETGPVVVLAIAPDEHGQRASTHVEVMAPDRERAVAFLETLKARVRDNNVYRGKVLTFAFTEWGRFNLAFHRLPKIERGAVILPDEDLDAIERHTIGIAEQADALRRRGHHLKRGLLLYGPPGTGKTHSLMYLCNRMPGRTTLLLTGPGSYGLGRAMAIARALQPSMVVLEDVDLVAVERTMGPESNPLLYQLLNEMDGLAEDADVIFVLTTNRVELLEPALADRPGRIDEAVEVKLPDGDARRRLFELYLGGVDHDIAELAPFVERTDGVSAAFVKELVRRAVSGLDGDDRPLHAADLERTLDALLSSRAALLRNLLGAGPAD